MTKGSRRIKSTSVEIFRLNGIMEIEVPLGKILSSGVVSRPSKYAEITEVAVASIAKDIASPDGDVIAVTIKRPTSLKGRIARLNFKRIIQSYVDSGRRALRSAV